MKEKINPELLKLIEETFDTLYDQKKALHFCIAIFADTMDVLYEWGVMANEQEEHKFRIALMERNIEEDSLQAKYSLRYPLFVDEIKRTQWDEFYEYLTTNPRLKSVSARFVQKHNGLIGKNVFTHFVGSIQDFDMGRLKACTEAYYLKEGQYSKNLVSYLDEVAKGQYMGYREVKSKLI